MPQPIRSSPALSLETLNLSAPPGPSSTDRAVSPPSSLGSPRSAPSVTGSTKKRSTVARSESLSDTSAALPRSGKSPPSQALRSKSPTEGSDPPEPTVAVAAARIRKPRRDSTPSVDLSAPAAQPQITPPTSGKSPNSHNEAPQPQASEPVESPTVKPKPSRQKERKRDSKSQPEVTVPNMELLNEMRFFLTQRLIEARGEISVLDMQVELKARFAQRFKGPGSLLRIQSVLEAFPNTFALKPVDRIVLCETPATAAVIQTPATTITPGPSVLAPATPPTAPISSSRSRPSKPRK
eukprot:TRINITY_DN2178_c0_g1_i3.p1 TRINITY_DN2178_c0_g1~~TRINITY_DN2178_c0_g1_i3.p1  ORF type:complete len:295 (-),score=44.72 TRINITY_DN2178_c0_g1_i3:129-1013(-)